MPEFASKTATRVRASLPSMDESIALAKDRLLRHGKPEESLIRSHDAGLDAKILIVDDEPINIESVQKHLRSAGYESFVSTSDARQAIELIRSERPDVVLLGITMPHVHGLDILEVLRGDLQTEHLPVLMLTAGCDEDIRSQAMELGATDFLSKPVRPTELILRIHNALIVKAHHDNLVKYSAQLEHEVQMRTAELAQSREEIIRVLACAAEYRDQETGNHVLRVGRYSAVMAHQLGFERSQAELIGQAAILHDAGKIGISDTILLKPGKLTPDEVEAIKRHCEYGMNILLGNPTRADQKFEGSAGPHGSCESPILKIAARIAISHHEKWDGTGYPRGLSGESIPIEGRITAVADVFDALSNERPYKEPVPLDECFEMLEEGRSTHFDPRVLDAFFTRTDDIVRIALDLTDG